MEINVVYVVSFCVDNGVIPVLNENDSVSTDEIGSAFGDNDKLGA